MKDSLYNYTFAVLNYLELHNITPELIQLGNEIDPGLLLPVGESMDAVATLLNSGIKAVRDFSKTSDIKPKIIIHYSDNAGAQNRIQKLINAGVTDFDIFGISYYDQWATIKFSELSTNIRKLKEQFSQDIMVVETAYQWTNKARDGKTYTTQVEYNGYPTSPTGQRDYLIDLTQHIIDGGGIGIIYWEPAWINSSVGFNWEVNSMFDFDGNVLPAINYMNFDYNY
jgi:arabinogalactan endo-1,4-beta-galactosidase